VNGWLEVVREQAIVTRVKAVVLPFPEVRQGSWEKRDSVEAAFGSEPRTS
jgi:hypothetical protein